MGDFTPVLVAIISTLGLVATARFAAQRAGRLGLGDDQVQVKVNLRELAETWEAKAALLEERLEAKEEKLRLTQALLDTCARQRDNLYAELRADDPKPRPIRRRSRTEP